MQRSILNKDQYPNGGANGAADRANNNATSNGEPVNLDLDAVVIGAGFAGVYQLHHLRKEGFNVKLVEAGLGLGGVWYWNNYPGARVDSPYPIYALSIPEVFSTWQWTQVYPGTKELQKYFQHCDKVLNISKDTLYSTRVNAARWDDSAGKWNIECDNGTKIRATYMICCLGFSAKRSFPDFRGLDDFKGYICHSSFWPEEGVNMHGKKVGIVGQGATGIQIAQEAAKDAEKLSVFIRTPNTAIRMNQQLVDPEQGKKDLESYVPQMLQTDRFDNMAGFHFPDPTKGVFDDTPEERERVLEEAWQLGGFRILFCYNDLMTSEKANRVAYDFWARKVRPRITDPRKREILAPLEPPHPFAAKRPSLEQDYYEQLDRPHVDLIDLNEVQVSNVVPEGIVTSDGKLHELDILAIATGFDSITGGFTQINIEGINGESLEKKWNGEQGALSYLGLTVANFPNMFYTYGPHGPTAYGNGPAIVEVQCDWITETMKRMREHGWAKINAKVPNEQEWKETVNYIHAMTLRHYVERSWYMGTNIPGKPRQALNYAGGLHTYKKTIHERMDNDFEGFELS